MSSSCPPGEFFGPNSTAAHHRPSCSPNTMVTWFCWVALLFSYSITGRDGKSSWPELVGANGDAASVVIMGDNPKVKASTVKEGSFVTTDFRCDRVRVWIDNSDVVTRVPQIG